MSAAPRSGRPPHFFGWKVVATAFVVAVFAWGTGFYGPPVYLHALEARGWSVGLISAAITWHFLSSALLIAALVPAYRRWGMVRVTRVGAAATALGLLAWSLAPDPWLLFPAAMLSGAGWAATSGAAVNAMIAPWFERRRPAALAMAYNGASVGGIAFAPLWAVLIASLGFPAAAAIVAAALVLVLWPLAGRYLAPTPQALGLGPDGDTADARRVAPTPPVPAPLGGPRFVTLATGFSLGLVAQVGLIVQLFSLLVPALGDAGAGLAMSLATAGAVAGRTLFGWLLPTGADRRRAAAVNFAVQMAGMAALLAAGGQSPWLLLLGCALFGLGIGNMITLPPLIAQAEFDRASVAGVVALVVAITQAAYAFAPALFGLLRELGGEAAMLLAAALLQASGAAVVLAGRRARA